MPDPSRCPICGKPAAPRTRPFCGPRCADVDLGRWLTGQYRVPAEEKESAAPDGDEVADDAGRNV